MLKINEHSAEAVAALLYNNIYDLSHASEGAWCIEERRDDPAYLAFAESLLQVVRASPDAPDHDLIQQAVQLTNQNRLAGLAWATIVVDQEYASLPGETEKFFSEVRSFIKDPGLINLESNFLDFDLDVD
jgi:hypothetical protein